MEHSTVPEGDWLHCLAAASKRSTLPQGLMQECDACGLVFGGSDVCPSCGSRISHEAKIEDESENPPPTGDLPGLEQLVESMEGVGSLVLDDQSSVLKTSLPFSIGGSTGGQTTLPFGVGSPSRGAEEKIQLENKVDENLDENISEGEKIFYLTPKGSLFNQSVAKELSKEKSINLICGHFEGIDQRVIDNRKIKELSIGDFVLSGGETAAYVILDSILRLIPGVIGNKNSITEESFENGLLEYPQYTKPQIWEKNSVPEVLLSGDHAKIKDWRLSQSEAITRDRRPDMWRKYKKD